VSIEKQDKNKHTTQILLPRFYPNSDLPITCQHIDYQSLNLPMTVKHDELRGLKINLQKFSKESTLKNVHPPISGDKLGPILSVLSQHLPSAL
jgi:hypothetical protein